MGAPFTYTVVPVGDSAVMVVCGSRISKAAHLRIRWFLQVVRQHPEFGVSEWVPGYTCVLGRINGLRRSAAETAGTIGDWLRRYAPSSPGGRLTQSARAVQVPVVYGGAYGPDLEALAHLHGTGSDELARLHADALYQVYFIGFTPGFPYLSGLPRHLASPRRTEPRTSVAPGSVGIGGKQTGIYPSSSPGGWQLIGRTPVKMFDLHRDDPFFLHPGDNVVFERIEEPAFDDMARALGTPSKQVAAALNHQPGMPRVHSGGQSSRGIEVVKSGLLTSVQDLGRSGHEDQGVALAGVMDRFAASVANLLVGNPPGAALLECTLVGPVLRLNRDTVIAVTGADLSPYLDGQAIPMWQSVVVRAGSEMTFRGYKNGCRAYLACAGGVDTPQVMGSRSTDLTQGFGGWNGRALMAGDTLPTGQPVAALSRLRGRALPRWARPVYHSQVAVGFLPSQTPSRVDDNAVSQLEGTTLTVLPQSDRMGIRLSGWERVHTPKGRTVVSEPVQPGTIQLPAGGEPIVLMVDAQTVGGYPTVGLVCTADLPKLAQLSPGAQVRLDIVSEAAARQKLRVQTDVLRWLVMANQSL